MEQQGKRETVGESVMTRKVATEVATRRAKGFGTHWEDLLNSDDAHAESQRLLALTAFDP